MIAFYFTFLAVVFAGLGARDQALVAALSRHQGPRPGVLIVAGVLGLLSAALAAWLALAVTPLLGPEARTFFAGLALLFAGGESLVLVPRREPREPSHSLGALAIILASQQLTDAARFLVFGIAVATSAPLPAGGGGALGGLVAVGAAWAFPEWFTHPRVRLVRRLVGAGLALVGAYVCLSAIGKL